MGITLSVTGPTRKIETIREVASPGTCCDTCYIYPRSLHLNYVSLLSLTTSSEQQVTFPISTIWKQHIAILFYASTKANFKLSEDGCFRNTCIRYFPTARRIYDDLHLFSGYILRLALLCRSQQKPVLVQFASPTFSLVYSVVIACFSLKLCFLI